MVGTYWCLGFKCHTHFVCPFQHVVISPKTQEQLRCVFRPRIISMKSPWNTYFSYFWCIPKLNSKIIQKLQFPQSGLALDILLSAIFSCSQWNHPKLLNFFGQPWRWKAKILILPQIYLDILSRLTFTEGSK